eukprot:CAMPEP_0205827822 /NCGR_PEP_ID=MMETSP0206-20130828/33156_1 /ASSEMBLY_ACC=CAM_ASM_000279 /TAXON_ID=36767 /ORGANISM="Euplotes focardii, Strain TN1" /LENGTH=127 /DNA_ID=CAMNT_0053129055 /DNA_START=383 /DNA_END=766 /DNA_ORIENTATION=+
MSKNEPLNERGERGVIINVSSISATYAGRGLVSYGASKGAINGMTLPMSRDLGRYGIRVLNIAPTVFQTEMVGVMPKILENGYNKMVPLGRVGEVDEFAHLVKTCVENGYLNGVSLIISGGMIPSYM